ncbi:MAG TPA: tetratricopeptide repeat protein [Candidatus Doudnabacteria bacterium]|nr:tetratricopeptide repeat protein [Candidatus Doudnabacteria bacterium]
MNITFVLSILGVILMVLRHLPQATRDQKQIKARKESASPTMATEALEAKGLPAQAYSRTLGVFKLIKHKIWQFVLEAKGLKQSPKISYQFQRIFNSVEGDGQQALIKNEKYYIDLIKRNPKDNTYYDMLGQYYLEHKKMNDAVSVYDYLVNHVPTEAIFWVRLGLASLYLQEYGRAEEAYTKAVKLDPTSPSRFYNLALAQQGLKKYSEAVISLTKALELEPKNSKYQDLRFEMESKAKSSIPLENIHKKS